MAISTDENKIKKLLDRGVENIYSNRDFLEERLKSGKQLSLYTGYDPTAPTLHIGHGITLIKLRQFQELGHKVIMLIGDFTGMIGDPTDKSSARVQLTKEQVLENSKGYQKQAARILDFEGENAVEVKYNSEWLAKMSFADVLDLTSHFTVQRMLERDMFQERIKSEKPIYVHEFMYPVMQGYDCVAMDVDGEVGGNDQTFNMLAGRTLMKDLKKKEKFVLTMKLLTDSSGKKMGKSEGNMIALSDSASDMFGKVMSWTDSMILSGFELCTMVPMENIKKINEEIVGGANPRDFKLKLAYEITKQFLGEDAAKEGQNHFTTVIQKKDKPDKIEEIKPSNYDIINILVESKLVGSKTEARKMIIQGGIKVDDKKIVELDHVVESGSIVQKGKRFFIKVI